MSHVFDLLRNLKGAVPDSTPVVDGNRAPGALNDQRAIHHIAAELKPESRILSASDHQTAAREHFRYIEHKLYGLRKQSQVKRILVTSSVPREGKTVVATNLATTLASGSSRVLLIDGDMRGPGSANLFGLGEARGLAEALEGRAEASEVVTYLDGLNVYYVAPGVPTGSPGDLLDGARVGALLEALDEFDWIIIDSPPVAIFVDALSLATCVDTVVLVARAGVTRRQDLRRTVEALKANHTSVAAVILNACDQPRRHDSYYSHYESGRAKAAAGT